MMKCTKWKWFVVCDKLTKCPPELDSGAFSKIRFWNEGEAPDQGLQRSRQCDGKEGAVRKGYEHCVKKIEKGTGSSPV